MRTPPIHTSALGHVARGRPRASRNDTVARVLQLIDEQHWPLRMADLCNAASVSERTMRTIIKEQFELGPSRYLRLRRLQMLREALAHADPHGTTVAAVSARFGYSHGGRMASEYHELFGEYPSQTLGKAFLVVDDRSEGPATPPCAGPLDGPVDGPADAIRQSGSAAWLAPSSPGPLHGPKLR